MFSDLDDISTIFSHLNTLDIAESILLCIILHYKDCIHAQILIRAKNGSSIFRLNLNIELR